MSQGLRTTTGRLTAPRHDNWPADEGCPPYCASALRCPWRRCIAELPPAARQRFTLAFETVIAELVPPREPTPIRPPDSSTNGAQCPPVATGGAERRRRR